MAALIWKLYSEIYEKQQYDNYMGMVRIICNIFDVIDDKIRDYTPLLT